jgi:myo-inositol 2-dehydrogenase/D-chiro-inositol 1-dehydrogenase
VARPTLDDGIDGQPLVSAEEGRKRIIVCLEAERAVAEGREIALRF